MQQVLASYRCPAFISHTWRNGALKCLPPVILYQIWSLASVDTIQVSVRPLDIEIPSPRFGVSVETRTPAVRLCLMRWVPALLARSGFGHLVALHAAVACAGRMDFSMRKPHYEPQRQSWDQPPAAPELQAASWTGDGGRETPGEC